MAARRAAPTGRASDAMKYPVTVKKLIDGKWQARCLASVVGEVVALGDDREGVLERMRNEIRYRLEFCP
jgi:hypothetical protein